MFSVTVSVFFLLLLVCHESLPQRIRKGNVRQRSKSKSSDSDLPLPLKAMQNIALGGGDMMGLREGGTMYKSRLWLDGVIPYEISPELWPHEDLILQAMRHIESKTCIRFQERHNEKDYVDIFQGAGCYSYIGKRQQGGKQPLSLGKGCGYLGTIIHELMHAIGFHHEQNRYDRDDYVKIIWNNINPKFKNQFQKVKPNDFPHFYPFDYNSIMLYGSYTFSKDRKKPTMLAKYTKISKILPEVYKKTSLSVIDAKRVNKLYSCGNDLFKRIFAITEIII